MGGIRYGIKETGDTIGKLNDILYTEKYLMQWLSINEWREKKRPCRLCSTTRVGNQIGRTQTAQAVVKQRLTVATFQIGDSGMCGESGSRFRHTGHTIGNDCGRSWETRLWYGDRAMLRKLYTETRLQCGFYPGTEEWSAVRAILALRE